jgi:hypothetical protein
MRPQLALRPIDESLQQEPAFPNLLCDAPLAQILDSVTQPEKAVGNTPPGLFADPASACTAGGGKYLGDMKCQFPNGMITPTLYGAAAQRAMTGVGGIVTAVCLQPDTRGDARSKPATPLRSLGIDVLVNEPLFEQFAGESNMRGISDIAYLHGARYAAGGHRRRTKRG